MEEDISQEDTTAENTPSLSQRPSNLFSGLFFRETGQRALTRQHRFYLTRYQRLLPNLYRQISEGGLIVDNEKLTLEEEFEDKLYGLTESKKALFIAVVDHDLSAFRAAVVRVKQEWIPRADQRAKDFVEYIFVMIRLNDLTVVEYAFQNKFPEALDVLWELVRELGEDAITLRLAISMHRPLHEIIPLFNKPRTTEHEPDIWGSDDENEIEEPEREWFVPVLSVALYYASLEGHSELVNYCVEQGAPIDGIRHNIPLNEACFHGHDDIVRYLVRKGARIHEDFLCHAVEGGYFNIVKILMESKTPPNADSALRDAIDEGYTFIVEYLFARGANVFRLQDPYVSLLFKMQQKAGWDAKWFIETYINSVIRALSGVEGIDFVPDLLCGLKHFLQTLKNPSEENLKKLAECAGEMVKVMPQVKFVYELFLRNIDKLGSVEELLKPVRPQP